MQITNVVSGVVSNVVSLSQVQLTDRQHKIVNLIKEPPFISAQEMSVALSVVHRTIQRDLSAIQKMGILVKPEYGTDSASTKLQSRVPTLLLTLLPTLFLPLLPIPINLSLTMEMWKDIPHSFK